MVRWVYEANSDEAIDILRRGEHDGRAAPGYAAQLEFNGRDQRLWPGVMQVMSCFSIPGILDDLSPAPGEEFNYKEFLKGRNTLYFVSKQQSDYGGVAPIVTTIVEQFFRSARGAAMKNPTGRLDPPLTFELNQVTDICPIGGLPTYMGESGGYGITVHAYLTSLADARMKWGSDGTARLWDNATFRIISGGTGTPKDLAELSDLVGKHNGKPAAATRRDQDHALRPRGRRRGHSPASRDVAHPLVEAQGPGADRQGQAGSRGDDPEVQREPGDRRRNRR